jgi:hypothetical protein
MSQYYKVIILDENNNIISWLHPYDFDNNGMKLMEHSYIDNKVLNALEFLIRPGGLYYKSRIVWAGEYNSFEENQDNNLYHLADNSRRIIPKIKWAKQCPYIVNHTKKLYVNKHLYISDDIQLSTIHPLPLLVSHPNLDYNGTNTELCSTWSRDIISVERNIPDGFTELICEFKE